MTFRRDAVEATRVERFSIADSFLKNEASTETRLIRRFTASSARSMSRPKTRTLRRRA